MRPFSEWYLNYNVSTFHLIICLLQAKKFRYSACHGPAVLIVKIDITCGECVIKLIIRKPGRSLCTSQQKIADEGCAHTVASQIVGCDLLLQLQLNGRREASRRTKPVGSSTRVISLLQ